MYRIPAVVAAFILLLATGQPRAAEPAGDFFFKSGDRIVFLGDSITEQYQYSSYIELYLTTRFPKWNLTFINAGISGDTANGGAGRFQAHVLNEKPTAVTIDFGMNDGGYGAFNPNSNKNYVAKTEQMLEMAKKNNARVALISPNAVERRKHENYKLYFETQKQFYAPLAEIASKFQVPFVDQYAVTRSALEKMAVDDPEAKVVNPFPDGVHTAPSGGLLMAHTILVGLKAPALVSDVTIDAAAGKSESKGCAVAKLKSSSGSVSFERTDDALPLPMQKDWVTLLPYVNQLKDLNWYGLKVTGLDKGKYKLEIDGKEVGTFTSEELAAGVNVGNLMAGPIYEQGQKVLQAINAKNQQVHQRFRGVLMFQAPDWLADVAAERKPAELVKRMDKINALQADIYKMTQPVARSFELKSVQ
jgi:lysophospholipase L1-like esterase